MDYLNKIAKALDMLALEAQSGLTALDKGQASALMLEAKASIAESLGALNDFGFSLGIKTGLAAQHLDVENVREASATIRAAVRTIERRNESIPKPLFASGLIKASVAVENPSSLEYVSRSLIEEVKGLPAAKLDFRKLAELLRELNAANAQQANMSTAMIVRAIADHVPPALGCRTFAEVASSYGGAGKSFRQHMTNLDGSLRKLADSYLHLQIRQRETLPTREEVDFRGAVGELVREIVRVNRIG